MLFFSNSNNSNKTTTATRQQQQQTWFADNNNNNDNNNDTRKSPFACKEPMNSRFSSKCSAPSAKTSVTNLQLICRTPSRRLHSTNRRLGRLNSMRQCAAFRTMASFTTCDFMANSLLAIRRSPPAVRNSQSFAGCSSPTNRTKPQTQTNCSAPFALFAPLFAPLFARMIAALNQNKNTIASFNCNCKKKR